MFHITIPDPNPLVKAYGTRLQEFSKSKQSLMIDIFLKLKLNCIYKRAHSRVHAYTHSI